MTTDLLHCRILKSVVLSKKFKSKGNTSHLPLRIYRGTQVSIEKTSKVYLNQHGRLQIGNSWNVKEYGRRFSFLSLGANSILNVKGNMFIYSRCYITLRENAMVTFGNGYMNNNCQIICSNFITLGNGVFVGPDVIIRDSDDHTINENQEKTKPITIGDHVWI